MNFTTRPELQGSFGMVASTHWLGSAAGMAMLERGGNAFDAAAACGFVLQVVEPHLCGPLGDLPILLSEGGSGRVHVICGQGPAPAAAAPDRFRDLGLAMVPGTGLLAACVPGAFGAWARLLAEFGTMRLHDVLEPALGYAEGGWPVLPRVAMAVDAVRALFRESWPTSAEAWLGGGGPAAGATFQSPDLAATYRRVLREAEAGGGGREAEIERGLTAWYEGFVAEAVDQFARTELMDSSGSPHGGLLRGSDMAGWRAGLEEPVHVEYRERYRVFKCGPWSQGPVFLQQLRLLEGFDLAGMGAGSADFIHSVVECAKLAFADREAWYGDPVTADVPLAELLSPAYAAERRALVGAGQAVAHMRPGRPGGGEGCIPWADGPVSSEATGLGDPTWDPRHQVRGDTVHVDAADRWGNLISATPSGGWLQSSPVVPGLGFPLGTRAQLFNLSAGHPNCIGPGRRPRTTLSPSIAFRDGEPWLAFGSPGADQQDQWTLNWFVMLTSGSMNLQEAVDAPMWHTDHFPRSFFPHDRAPRSLIVESRVDEAVVRQLRDRGHEVTVAEPWTLGRISAVARDPGRGLLAAANPRGMQGYAAGR